LNPVKKIPLNPPLIKGDLMFTPLIRGDLMFTRLIRGNLIFPPFEKGGRGDFETKGISY
jgi:hypothetical protein